jgi:5'-deoxynucleotidase YfbR-like HD superfamily hydrolase
MRLDKTFGLLSGLSGTQRFSNAKLIHPESVLEHLGAVTLMCFLIRNEMPESYKTFDLGEVLGKAITHDVEEMLTGDIPRTTKHASQEVKDMFATITLDSMKSISESLELKSEALFQFHLSAKKNFGGMLVQLCDTLAVVYKIQEEAIDRGNRSMMSRSGSVVAQLEMCQAKIGASVDLTFQSQLFLQSLIDQARAIVARAHAMMGDSDIAEMDKRLERKE